MWGSDHFMLLGDLRFYYDPVESQVCDSDHRVNRQGLAVIVRKPNHMLYEDFTRLARD